MNNLTEMNAKFQIIARKRLAILDMEEEIRVNFEKIVIDFFKEKGINLKLLNNKYDPINRYYLDIKSDNFKFHEYQRYGSTKVQKDYYTPKFDIVPWTFTIKFEWHKATNQNPTQVYWHPEEMSLETFYNKKLKKVFDLLQK